MIENSNSDVNVVNNLNSKPKQLGFKLPVWLTQDHILLVQDEAPQEVIK